MSLTPSRRRWWRRPHDYVPRYRRIGAELDSFLDLLEAENAINRLRAARPYRSTLLDIWPDLGGERAK